MYGLTGRRYLLQAAAVVDGREGWVNAGLVVMNHDYEEVVFDPPNQGNRFYRLVETGGLDAGLRIERAGHQLRYHWNAGTLKLAPTVTGPGTPVSGAAPPEHFAVPGQATGFYRVRQ